MKLSDVQDEDGDTPYSFVPNPDFDTFKISSAQQEKVRLRPQFLFPPDKINLILLLNSLVIKLKRRARVLFFRNDASCCENQEGNNCFTVAIPCYHLKALLCLIYALLYGWNCHGTYINWSGTPAAEGEGHTFSVANGIETVGINRGINSHQVWPLTQFFLFPFL